MITSTSRATALRTTTAMVVMLTVLWFYPLLAAAGDLFEVPAGIRPELNLPDLSGQPRNLGEFTGKVLLINFWASWCRPCIEEVPGIQRLIEVMAEKPFAVLGVNVGEAERRVQTTVKRLRMEFPVLLDKDSAEFNSWGANVLPTAYVLDGSGQVRYIGRGPVEWDRADIVELLGELVAQQANEK